MTGGAADDAAGAGPIPAVSPVVPAGLEGALVLLRHGESEWIREGRFQGGAETPLSAVGRRQADLAAARLARPHAAPALPVPTGPLLEIVHSPLSRAADTAAAVEAALHGSGEPGDEPGPAPRVPRRAADGLREIGQGAWEGITHDDIARRWPRELTGWRLDPAAHWAPEGESLASVQARLRPELDRILARLGEGFPRGRPDVPQVAGYGGVGPGPGRPWSIVVAHDGVFKILLLTLFDLPLANFWMFTMALCGITVVELRGGRPVLRAHNMTEHLAPLLDERAQEVAERRAKSGAL